VRQLLEAIKKRFDESDLKGRLTGGLHLSSVPPEPSPPPSPYGVLQISETPWWTFRDNFERYTLTILLCSRQQGSEEILELRRLMKLAFDEAPLVIEGYHLIRLWRGDGALRKSDAYWTDLTTYYCQLEQTT